YAFRSPAFFKSARRAESLSARTALSSSKACRTNIQYDTPRPQQSRNAAASVKRITSCEAIDRGSVGFENITGAANRVDQFGLERVVYLRPQSSHHHVYNIRVRLEIDVPDLLHDFRPRHHFTGKTSQMSQEKEFLGREIKRDAGTNRLMAARVDFEVFDPQLLSLLRWRPAQH